MRFSTSLLLLALAGCTEDAASVCDDPGTICTAIGEIGVAELTADGAPLADTRLYLPIDMTVGPDGTLYFIDWNNHRIRYADADGITHTAAGTGILGDGPEGVATHAAMNHPTNVLFNPDNPNEMYIAAWHNSRIEKVDLVSGNLTFECGTGARAYGGDGGDAKVAKLDLPSSILFDDDGSLLVADAANQLIRRIDVDGVITTVAGTPPMVDDAGNTTERALGWTGDGGPALDATFNMGWGQKGYPSGRIAKRDRTLYIADSYNHVVRQIDLDTWQIDNFAGTGLVAGHAGDGGPATEAELDFPTDLDVDADGNVYIADTFNGCIRKVDTDGVISTVAGICGEPGSDGDEGPATSAHLLNPYGIELGDGVLYIADTENQVIRTVKL